MKDLSSFIRENIMEGYYKPYKRKETDAEIMESVICFAHNRTWEAHDEKWHLEFVAPHDRYMQAIIRNKYWKSPKIFNEIAMTLRCITNNSALLTKLPDGAFAVNEPYIKGNVSKVVPKTDVHNKKNTIKISFKKVGSSQLCSGNLDETKGIMLSCANMLDDEKKEKLGLLLAPERWYSRYDLDNTVTHIKENPKNKFHDEIINAEKVNKVLTNDFKELMTQNPGFTNAVIREAALGEHKFGTDSPAVPNYFFIWDDETPSNSKLYTAEEYLQKLYGAIKVAEKGDEVIAFNKSVNITAGFKSDKNSFDMLKRYAYTAFRIEIFN